MTQLDIEDLKAELEEFKRNYASTVEMVNNIKTNHPDAVYAGMDENLRVLKTTIENQTNLIANYENLCKTARMLEKDITEEERRVRPKLE